MPWHLEYNYQDCSGWAVVKDDDGSIAGCHGEDKAEAQAKMAALYASEGQRAVIKIRLQEPDGQFCPICDGWIDISEVGPLTCPHCQARLIAEDTDSDYEDWHLFEEQNMDMDEQARGFFDTFWQGLKDIFIDRQWSGAASNYASTDAYCSACLIDLNSAAGRDEKVQSLCMLPVKRPGSDSIDPEGLQAAAGGRGITRIEKPADVSQDDFASARKAAANTIISNYPRLLDRNAPDSVYEIAGKEPPAERAISNDRLYEALLDAMFRLDEQYEGSDNRFMDVYHDDGGMYALYIDRGKLYRHPVNIQNGNVSLGGREEVMEIHIPVMPQARTIIRQMEDGRHRWFSISATAVLNRVGEIDSRDLFDSFVAHSEETGEYPIRQFYHQGEVFRTGQADYLARYGYCYITSGLYDDTPLARAEVAARQKEPDYWGDSIGFLPKAEPEMAQITDDIKIPVYRQGINTEISTLPESEAASLFTRTEVTRMSLMDKAGKAWEAWLKLWEDDEEAAQGWLEEHPEARNRAIETSKLIARDNGEDGSDESEPEPEPDDEGQEAPPAPEESPEFVVDDEVIDQLTQRMQEAEFVTALVTRLAEAEAAQQKAEGQVNKLEKQLGKFVKRLEALEADDDGKRQRWLDDLPAKTKTKRPSTRVVYRPRTRQSDNGDEEVDEVAAWQEEKKTKKIPSY